MKVCDKKIYLEDAVLEKLITSENSCVEVIQQERHNRIAYYGNNFSSAIKEHLNVFIGNFSKDLNGIILGHKNIKILSRYFQIDSDGFNNFIIRADFFVFKPILGKELLATVTKKTGDHVSCLVYNTFNMSIPKPQGVVNWAGNNVEIGQEIVARVTYFNLESRIPYIRGEFLEKFSVNKKIKFNDLDEVIDNQDSFNIEDDTANTSKKKKRSRKSLENGADEMSVEPMVMKESPDRVSNISVCNIENDTGTISKKKKRSRRSLENGADEMSVEPTVMKDSPDRVSNISVCNIENDTGNISKKKKRSRRSLENGADEMSVEPTVMNDSPDRVSNISVCNIENDTGNISKKKKRSRRSLENGADEISVEPMEMKEDSPDEVSNISVYNSDHDSATKKKKESRKNLENHNEVMDSERQSKKRRNSSNIEEERKAKRKKVD